MEEGKIVSSVTIDGDSPWFSGHFPGDPILPGIAQLKMVADLVIDLNARSGAGNLCMKSLSRVKFRKIVRPGELLDIQVTRGDKEDQYIFKITCGDQGVCSGWMFFTQTNPQNPENTKTKK